MDANRKIAIVVGVLFILGTVSGVLSVVFSGSILSASDYLVGISEKKVQFIVGALCVLTMGFSLALIPLVIFPVLKKHSEPLALGYVVFRGTLETATYIATVVSWLLLVAVSQEYVTAGAADASFYQLTGSLLQEANGQISHVLKIVFPIGALMFNYVLYRWKLVPRWLSGWGLIGVTLHFAEGLLTLFGVLPSSVETIMAMPIAVQEMVFAVWLIARGFNTPALSSGSA